MFHLGYYLESSGNCITLIKFNRILFLDLPDELKINNIPYQNSILGSFKLCALNQVRFASLFPFLCLLV